MTRHSGVAAIMGLACLSMALTWRTPWVYPLLLASGGCMLRVGRDRRDLWFYALGLTFGAGIDVAQSAAGVTVYAAPAQLLFLPTFVFFYWALALVAVRHLNALLPPVAYHPTDWALLIGAIGLSLFANRAPEGMAIAMLALLGLRFWRFRRPHDLVAMAVAMLLGPGSESLLMGGGLYFFPSAHGALVPLWLVACYACVGVAARGLVAVIERELARFGRQGAPSPSRD